MTRMHYLVPMERLAVRFLGIIRNKFHGCGYADKCKGKDGKSGRIPEYDEPIGNGQHQEHQ
jgi:hypothetical protein